MMKMIFNANPIPPRLGKAKNLPEGRCAGKGTMSSVLEEDAIIILCGSGLTSSVTGYLFILYFNWVYF